MLTLVPKPPPAKKARRWTRKTFAGTILIVGLTLWIQLDRGAWCRSIDKVGDVVADFKDPRATLRVNIGDRLLVFGVELDEIAHVEVRAIDQQHAKERVRIDLVFGVMPYAGHVWIMKSGVKS